jgi:hypothetical protein
MGFGLLFMGYFLSVFNVPVLGVFGTVIRMIGIAVMFFAFDKLKHYQNRFLFAQIGAIVMLLVSLLSLSVGIDSILYEDLITADKLFGAMAVKVIGYVEQGVTLIYNSIILWAVYYIARETEARKIAVGAVRNFVFICIYLFTYLVSFLPFAGIQSAQHEFMVICWILYFVWVILNVVSLFNCYATICDENDVEMEVKPSRFAFVNKIRDEHERRSLQAREADEAYRRERDQRRSERKKRRGRK